jgi:precorrin-3B methylase
MMKSRQKRVRGSSTRWRDVHVFRVAWGRARHFEKVVLNSNGNPDVYCLRGTVRESVHFSLGNNKLKFWT